jgi:RNA polymerase sigma-70 factor (ECF subfamily)
MMQMSGTIPWVGEKSLGKNGVCSSYKDEMARELTMNKDIVDWLTVNLLPFEADLRVKLRRACSQKAEVDDVVQEVYCKVMQMASVAHINDPKGFLVQTAKNIVTDRFRRDAVVRIEAVANLEDLAALSATPSAERIVLARAELKWVLSLVATLPDRCREVFRARRIYGLSQKEAAESLGITEKAVEYEATKGMEMISDMIAKSNASDQAHQAKVHKIKRVGKDNVSDR